ncbi:hypothetical protein LCGC14_1444370 [marine sediment metagenome]|uniref:Uncharacterized protein n=1 Tax=marine sediment metagenome TaxID=412755 RepID=A0A0F9JKB2_9ZZZZ
MRLKEIIAEHLYLIDTSYSPEVKFKEQDSNVRDFYYRAATDVIPQIIAGYLSSKGYLTKLIRGCVRDFINSHEVTLNKENSESLVKRIISNLRNI